MIKYLFVIVCALTLISGCTSRTETDDALIQTYLSEHNLTAQKDASGIYYLITKQGTGINATASSSVTVNYTGKFLDGSTFDSGNNVTFELSGVIEGWKIGIPLMKEGSEGTLFIPSK